MRQRKILLALTALAIGGLVCVRVVLFSGSGSRAITVSHVKTIGHGPSATAIFMVSNQTPDLYFVCSPCIEAHYGSFWKERPEAISGYAASILRGHDSYSFQMTNLPTEVRLRLKVLAGRELPGLQGAFNRLLIRLFGGTQVSVDPFDKLSSVFAKPKPFLSEEFTEASLPVSHEPKPSANGSASKPHSADSP